MPTTCTPVPIPPVTENSTGGYSYMDFVRAGAPLNRITWLAAMVAIPIFFPL